VFIVACCLLLESGLMRLGFLSFVIVFYFSHLWGGIVF
jgi:hypothetical protein